MPIIAHPEQLSLLDGKVCSTCRIWKLFSEYYAKPSSPLGYYARCKECNRAVERATRNGNDERNAWKRAWVASNQPRAKATKQKYKTAHRDRVNDQRRRSYAANPEKYRRRSNAYFRNHPAEKKAWRSIYRARLVRARGEFTPREWRDLCAWFGNRCLDCGSALKLTVDHVIPLSLGGANSIDNIQPLCHSCNSRKKDRTIDFRDPDVLAGFLERQRLP